MLKTLHRENGPAPVKVLQFGKGNFLRAFADWMIDVMNEKTSFNGAVQMVQVNSTVTDDRFAAQDGLYHVVINGIRDGKPVRDIRLIHAVAGLINPFADYPSFLATGENPHLQFIISNTTEAGITFDPSDHDASVQARTFPGKLTALLFHRYKFFQGDPAKAVTILPCELIEHNGEALRNAVYQYADHWNLEVGFKAWITDHTLFCNTLVDRIVPGFPKDRIDEIHNETGYRDDLVVAAEPYHLWIIQPLPIAGFSAEKFMTAFPAHAAGLQVKVVSDLRPYRISKVRILNGAHTCMVPLAWLRGFRTVREAVEDPSTGAFIRDMIREEIIPTLDLPKEELNQFADDVFQRFQNPFIRHELSSIALNSISKFQVRVLPSILEYHQRTGKLPDRLLKCLAALILFYKGEWSGNTIPLNDTPAVLDFFKQAWSTNDPQMVVDQTLGNKDFWKTDLREVSGLKEVVRRWALGIGDWGLGIGH